MMLTRRHHATVPQTATEPSANSPPSRWKSGRLLGWLAVAGLPLLAVLILPGMILSGMSLYNTAQAGQDEKNGPIRTLTILAAGDLRGEIEPCGCSPEGQLGGLRRRMSYLERRFASGQPLLVDLGNNFPPPQGAPGQGRLKVKLINTLLPRFAPRAILPGPNEIAFGLRALNRRLPYLLSNDAAGKFFAPYRTVRRDGLVIGIYGYLSPNEVYQGSQSAFRLVKVDHALLRLLRSSIRREGHSVALLLFRGGGAELETFVKSGLFDLIVSGNPSDNELQQVTVRKVGDVSVPQVPTKGQGVLRIRLTLPPGKGGPARRRAVPPHVRVDWLTDKWQDHAGAAPAFKEYNRKVAASFTAFLKTMESQKRDSPYAGAQRCIVCHAAAGAAWEKSRHANALKTLEKVGKNFDPECLACHVVGRNRVGRHRGVRPAGVPGVPVVRVGNDPAPGGFLSRQLTPKLAGVQCENCHGPGRAHAANPTVKFAARPGPVPVARSADGAGQDPRANSRPGEFTCRTCHLGSHSPTFDFRAYWPKVMHGK